MVTEPPTKRRREDEPLDEARTMSTNWTRHPELWLERGDIILICHNTGFCVGQCVLSLNSPVFREMFRTVDPAQNEMSDGLPIVDLQDDAEEMCHLLKAIHYRQYVRKKSKPTFKVLAAILKLSTKYMIDHLREEFIDMLTTIFPSTLASMMDRSEGYVPDDLDALYAVELAKQYDVPIILPAACYMSSLRPVNEIMDPSTSLASTVTRCASAIFRDELMNAMDKALKHAHDIDQWLFKADLRSLEGNWGCAADKCCYLIDTWYQKIENRVRRLVESDFFNPSLGRISDVGNRCQVIRTRVDEHWGGIQREIWDALPSLCGFENWEAVNAAQAASSVAEDQGKVPKS